YNKDKTEILEEYDLEKGYLKQDTMTIYHEAVIGQEEIGHYETIREYPNGGKDVEYVIDQPYIASRDAYSENKIIYVYIEYTTDDLKRIDAKKEMEQYKTLLSEKDYKAIKYAEGWYSEEEYKPTKELRESYRNKIRECENIINSIEE
ncbi:MAG: hypothetical protein IJY76_01005, partial [Anaerotignum sp.]|nr:hypothetical protein [Anaerotignum sp.]